MRRNKFLLVTRAGPESLHRQWVAPDGVRNFDLFVSAYDPAVEPMSGEGLYHELRAGRKVAGYGAFLRAHRALWEAYDYVALFDDDLLIDAAAISRLFALAAQHDLRIAQPALSRQSHFTYAALLQHPDFMLRYVTYIEMMCPLFRTDKLAAILPLFELGYESGIDIIWSNLGEASPHDMAVIDAVTVHHTRPVGSRKSANGFSDGKRYEDDISAVLRSFDCPWLPCVPYEGVRTDGSVTTKRTAYAANAASLLSAIPHNEPIKVAARNIAVYWKHLLSAPARNLRLSWPADMAPSQATSSKMDDALRRDPSAHEIEQP